MTMRTISFCTLLLVWTVMYVTAQTSHPLPISAQIAVQSEKIQNTADSLKACQAEVVLMQIRIEAMSQDLATIRGAIIGFGGLLSVLQVVGLIRKPKAE